LRLRWNSHASHAFASKGAPMMAMKKTPVFSRLSAASLIALALMSAAFAQTPGAVAKPNTAIPDKQHLGPVNPPHAGVVKPTHDTDPEMTKKPPPQDPAETPVIPPSATPGGNEAK
jgi:hypothetical protein